MSLNTSTTAIGTTDIHGVGFRGILEVPSTEPLLEGVRLESSIPPPPENDNPAARKGNSHKATKKCKWDGRG